MKSNASVGETFRDRSLVKQSEVEMHPLVKQTGEKRPLVKQSEVKMHPLVKQSGEKRLYRLCNSVDAFCKATAYTQS